MKIKVSEKKMTYRLLYLLVLYMPFHYYICELLLKRIQFDNVLRDFVIIILLILIFLSSKLKINKMDACMILNYIILTISAVVSTILFNYSGTFNILRTYIIPSLMFFICSRIELDRNKFIKINKLVVVELALISIYGFFQAFFLGDDFIINLGYPNNGGFLAGTSYYIGGYLGHQRSVGTFVSPNICGLILAIALCVLLFTKLSLDIKIKYRYLVLGMLVIGLISTFSRSAIIGFVLAYLLVFIISGKLKKLNIRKTFSSIIFILVAFISVVIVDKFFLKNLFSSMLKSSLIGTVSKSDLSASKHLSDLIEPLKIVLKNPFGLGFGNNGPMAFNISANANTVESSLYLMMYEVGILFGIIFFVPYVWVIVKTLLSRSYRYYVPASVCVVVLFTYLLLPNVQTYEVLFYSYMFIGFYFNPSVKKIILREPKCK